MATVPNAASVGDLVSTLVGKKVKVIPSTPPLPAASARAIATYIDPAGKLIYVALTDMAFLAGIGAALAMIPAPVAAEAIKSGKPAGPLFDNATEVMNIASALFNDTEGKLPHVKLQKFVVLTPPLPPEIAKYALKPPARIDLEVQLPGYTNGKLTIIALA